MNMELLPQERRKNWRAVFTTDRQYACVKRITVEVTGMDAVRAEASVRCLMRDMVAYGYSLQIEEVPPFQAKGTE